MRESDSGTLELYCSGDQCPGKLVNKLDHFCGKKGLDIKGLSKATLEKLIDWGWVSSISDICALGEVADLWASKPGFGPKSVTKLIDSIWKARETTLAQYLSAISIPLIGKTYARELAQIFITYQDFRVAVTPDPITSIEPFDFTQIDGFGPAMHDAIMSFDYHEADRMVDMCIIDFKEEGEMVKNGNSLQSLTICVTGKLKHWKNRDELTAAVTAAGAKVTSSVSSKTNYLVNNDITSTSSKNQKAKELNIPIITEEELLNMLN
jgi:DNA ligase (NAD+)